MTFTSIIIEFTLLMVFNGNKSAYANALGMDIGNFRRSCKASILGDNHGGIIEKSIDICVRAGAPVELALHDYIRLTAETIDSKPTCAFYYYISSAKYKLAELKEALEKEALGIDLYQISANQLSNFESILCGVNDSNTHACNFFHEMGQFINLDERIARICPCRVLVDSLDAQCYAIERRQLI